MAPMVSSLPGVVVLVLVNLPLTLSDKIFSLNLGTALISSSVSIPMSATVPGPIVETSLPSTAGRASRCVSTRHGGSVTVESQLLTVDTCSSDFLQYGSHCLRCLGLVLFLAGGGIFVWRRREGAAAGRAPSCSGKKVDATTLPPAASCRVRHTS